MSQDRINFEIDADLKSKASTLAEREDLSLSQFVRRLIRKAVDSTDISAPAQPSTEESTQPAASVQR